MAGPGGNLFEEENGLDSGAVSEFNENRLFRNKIIEQGQYERLRTSLAKVDNETKALKTLLTEADNDRKAFAKLTEEKLDELRKKHSDQIQTLSIFVAFFTFVSVEFGLLRSVAHPVMAVSYTLILLGSLTFFVVLIDVVLNDDRRATNRIRLKFSFLLLLSLFFIALGVGIIFKHSGLLNLKSVPPKNDEELPIIQISTSTPTSTTS
ncbi:hypothetical protein KBA63_05275 [Candidatus Woesebacteria bacterium]|nr:hypothetical protein [Candidatus Woesebacteria bacterium]MBP9687948.1 hypothetical protein [Candidatus Woesebacteria bacterium]